MQRVLRNLSYDIKACEFFVSIILIMLLPAACAPIVPVTVKHTETPASATQSIQPTSLPTITRARAVSPTLTPLPTWVYLPDWTPLPTLSDTQAAFQFQRWLQGSQDCLLPCWAGIAPGKTNWEEAKQILSSVLEIKTMEIHLTCKFGPCNYLEWEKRGDIYIRGSITSDSNELINLIDVGIEKPVPSYRVDKILKQYGQPERVFLQTTYNAVMDPDNIAFYLTLAYPGQNFIVQYLWMATKSGENTVGCIQDKGTSLSIDSLMNNQWSDDQLIDYIIKGGDDRQYIRPLEDVTNMTLEQFYETFKSISGDECISTPGKYWP